MAEYAYKMFNKDLTCTKGRGRFQYTPGEWIEEPEANCVKNGFHCAKNPQSKIGRASCRERV